jgi:serine/threonine-protein kinase
VIDRPFTIHPIEAAVSVAGVPRPVPRSPMADPVHERWAEISPYLDRALEMSAEERAGFVATLRAKDEALAALLTTLLDERNTLSREGFLEEGPLRPPEPSLAGQTIGAYTLVSLLGQGGMGHVWLARRSDGRFEGLVAIKLLNASLVGHAGAERFEREGRILARLAHPHIARLIDAGVWVGAQPYLVLEHVAGEPIDRYCDDRALGIDARLRLVLDVLAAVGHAHANLVVHRDLKPSNVLVAADGSVKLLDFGIAKLLQPEAGTAGGTAVTRDGQGALTPEYAAPEQLTAGDITTATDVYALGVLLYVLLAGRHPAGMGVQSAAELVRAIVETEPFRMSEAAPSNAAGDRAEIARRRATTAKKLAASLRGDLDNIVAKALRKKPAERYASVSGLADDLRRYLDHDPVSARPDSLLYRARKFARRHRAGVALAVLASVGTLAAGGVAVVQMVEARRQRDAALLEAKKARASSELARFVIDEGAEGARPDVIRGRLDRARTLLQGSWIDDPRIRIHLLLELVPRYLELGDVTTREELIREAHAAMTRIDDPALSAALACVEGAVHVDTGRFDDAEREIGQGLRLLASAGPDNGSWPECLLADTYRLIRTGRSRDAVERAQSAVGWLEQRGQRHTTTYSDALHALAASANSAGRFREARSAIRKSIEQRHLLYGEKYGEGELVSMSGEVTILRAGGKVLEARDAMEHIVSEWTRGPGSAPLPDFVMATRGRVAASLEGYDEAIRFFRQSLDEAKVTRRQEAALETRAFLIAALTEAGRIAEAAELLDETDKDPEAAPRPQGQGRVWLRLAEARLLAAKKELGPAAVRVRETVDGLVAKGAAHDPRIREAAALGAEIALRQGDLPEACRWATTALDEATEEAIDPRSSAWIGESLLLRARCQLGEAGPAAARADAEAAALHLEANLGPAHSLSRRAREVAALR